MAEWLARKTLNHNIMGSSPAQGSWLINATGEDNVASVHSVLLSSRR